MPEINPKMQPRIKINHRKWQHADDPSREYGYGVCPYCGNVGETWGDEPGSEDGVKLSFGRVARAIASGNCNRRMPIVFTASCQMMKNSILEK